MTDLPAEEETARQPVTQSEQWSMARTQQIMAMDGLAMNQCGYCGTYRLDGLPPVLRQTWCAVPYRGQA